MMRNAMKASFVSETMAPEPPNQVTPAAYRNWLTAIGSKRSKFFDRMFAWHAEQLASPLPREVNNDPLRLYIDVRGAMNQTMDLEEAGEIKRGNTIGFEAYALIDVPLAVALEAALFHYGKPISQPSGRTHPRDPVYGRTQWSLQDKWGAGNYFARSVQTRGGFMIHDLYDDHTVLVRGNEDDGYSIFFNFFGATPGRETATKAQFVIVMLKRSANGGIELRHAARRNGQTYGMGDFGRSEFGFNVNRIRTLERLVTRSMVELNKTGRIKENED
jgi:hypothetical protein